VIPSHSDRQESPSVTPEEKAAQFFRPCGACHSFSEGEPAKIGPNLWGVVGRPVASFPGFDYSERLLRRGGVWTEDRLIEFFEEEKHFEQGTHAAFRNMQTREDRELLLSLLKSLNSAP
jgi:cytochrome c